MDKKQNKDQNKDQNKGQQFANQGAVFIISEMIVPGAIKQRHLLPSPVRKGDIYYGDNGYFKSVALGSTGQTLMVIGGVPVWGSFPVTGIATARPTSGRFTGDLFYATDTKVLSLWDGGAWRTSSFT